MRRRLHIGWLLSGIILMLLTACSSSDGMEEKQPTMLTVYVYSPDRPMLIRSASDEVNPSVEESKITRLQIWIFENVTGNRVAYFDTNETSLLSAGGGATYKIPVSDDFAQRKPAVDVYVIANLPEGEYGNTLKAESTREEVLDATIPEGNFGLSPLVSTSFFITDPPGVLPMAGKLEEQPVIGDAPVLRVGTTTNIATVQLTRCVSKVRFVFANTTGSSDLYITGITLDAEMIPNEEYLIPRTSMETSGGYNATPVTLFSGSTNPVASVANPTLYIYDEQNAQDYEDLINGAGLTMVGPFYLRESDKQLSGTISYKIGEEGEVTNGVFTMNQAGEFSRNHTWIIYAYHLGGGFLEMNTLYLKNWTTRTIDHEVYNW